MPSVEQNCPLGQGEHVALDDWLTFGEYVPLGHDTKLVDAGPRQNAPAGQLRHAAMDDWPGSGLYVPSGQEDATLSKQNVPDTHIEQEANRLVELENVPAGHGTLDVPFGQKNPTGHAKHEDAPAESEMVPNAHGGHTDRPVMLPTVPTPHGLDAFRPMSGHMAPNGQD